MFGSGFKMRIRIQVLENKFWLTFTVIGIFLREFNLTRFI
jgi:hypothetical protein